MLTVLDTDGEPMRAGLRAEPDVVAPNVGEAEEAVGHEFNDADDLALGLSEPDRDGRGRGDHHPRDGCVAIVGDGAERRRYEARIEQLEPVAAVGSGDAFLAGYVAARYDGALARASASPSASPAAPSRPSTSAPATSTAREVERLLPRVEVRELELAAKVG